MAEVAALLRTARRPLSPLAGVVAIVSHCSPSVASLQHVLSFISDFLDFSGSWTIPKACARPGSLPLLRRLLQREKITATPLDPYYRDWIFNRGMNAAAKAGDLDVVKWLMTEYSPRTVVTLGVEVAPTGRHLDVLEWLYERDVEHGTALFGQQEMALAAEHGHLDVLQWLHDKCQVSSALRCVVSPAALLSIEHRVMCLQGAADNGHLEVVHWLVQEIDRIIRNQHGDNSSPGLHSLNLASMAKNGHLHVLEYLDDQAFAWLKLLPSPNTACATAENGHLDVLKWLLANDLVIVSNQISCMVAAAACGDLCMLQWMHQSFSCINVDAKVVFEAARNGHLNIVKYLHENVSDGSIFTVEVMDQAAANGHLEVVQWLHDIRTEDCKSHAMDAAAANGHLEVAKWLHENRSEGCSSFALAGAAKCGHLEIVKWLHENRTEAFTSSALQETASNGHLHVLRWLHSNRTEDCSPIAMDTAAGNGHLAVVEWLHRNRSVGCTTDAMDKAATNGHLDVVEWLHRNRSEGCTTEAMDEGTANGHLDMVQWLHRNRSEGYTTRAMDEAAGFGYFVVIAFLHENRAEGCSPEAFDHAEFGENLDILR